MQKNRYKKGKKKKNTRTYTNQLRTEQGVYQYIGKKTNIQTKQKGISVNNHWPKWHDQTKSTQSKGGGVKEYCNAGIIKYFLMHHIMHTVLKMI